MGVRIFAYTEVYEYTILLGTEFLKREFGIHLISVNPENMPLLESYVVVSNNPTNWQNFLKSSPKGSVKFILLGNETYDPSTYLALNSHDSISKVFIYNPPRRCSILGLRPTFGFIYDMPQVIFKYAFYRYWKNAIDFSIKSRRTLNQINYPFIKFPQGYTNKFVKELELLELLPSNYDGSLLTFFLKRTVEIKSKKISFVGQLSNWPRKITIESMQKVNFFISRITDGWGGLKTPSSTFYVESILNSTGVLNPPGHISNETYRYWESIILGRLPITTANSFQDHHYSDYWPEWSIFGFKKYSYRKLSKFVLKMSNKEYLNIIKKSRNLLINEVKIIKLNLLS